MSDVFNPAALTNQFFQDRATIDKTVADTSYINSQTAINQENLNEAKQLFPFKMEAAGLENQKTQADIEQLNSATLLNNLNAAKVGLQNQESAIELKYADEKARLANARQEQEIASLKAQAGLWAAQTKSALASVDKTNQEIIFGENAKVAQGLRIVSQLYDAGDVEGSNKAYQALLKTTNPAVLKFESNMFGTIGPDINPKRNPQIRKALEMAYQYTSNLVPQDSFMGQSQLKAQEEASRERVAQIEANARGNNNPIKTPGQEAEDTKKVESLITPQIYKGLSNKDAALQEKSGSLFIGGQPVNANGPQSAGIEAIKKTSAFVYSNFKDAHGKAGDITKNLTEQFTMGNLDLGDKFLGFTTGPVVVPAGDQQKKSLEVAIKSLVTKKGYTPEQAYAYLIQEGVNAQAKELISKRGLLKNY